MVKRKMLNGFLEGFKSQHLLIILNLLNSSIAIHVKMIFVGIKFVVNYDMTTSSVILCIDIVTYTILDRLTDIPN